MLWYPYAQMKTLAPPLLVEDAEGVRLKTSQGELIDSVSSWWSTIHGYKHPELNRAMTDQINKFSHVMLAGLTHEPALELADKLADWLPGDLDYVFFSDSGSVAVEVALKMALQYYVNQGNLKRTKVLALDNAYHGDTFKTLEVGDHRDYHFVRQAYGPSPDVVHVATEIPALEEAFAQHGTTLNSFIVEPLLQGAGGMRMYDIAYLKRARELCDEYDVVLIFDEVATGFGRTGHRFVSDLVQPDIIVIGKALTGGYIGHAATVASRHIYEGFLSDDGRKALMHGPTFMANPVACAVSRVSIELFERENYLEKIAHIEAQTHGALDTLSDERIKEIRIMGGCACIEVKEAKDIVGYQEFARARGVFARPFLNYIYAMVPYVINDDDLAVVLDTMNAWFNR